MKKLLTFIIATTLASPAFAESSDQQADSFYRKGIAAEKAGDPVAAKSAYEAALKANPKHADARYKLGQVKIHSKSIAAKGNKAKFDPVIIPEIKLADASFQESVELLRLMVEKESKGKVNPNFIINDPKGKLSGVKVNLVLRNMPAQAVMKYLLEQSGASARYDKYAIIISPGPRPK